MSVMRSTSKITNHNSIFYMTRSSAAMNNAYTKLSLERQVVNLSDNPMAANIGLRMSKVISQSEQYKRNIDMTGIPALRYAETNILDAKKLMDEVKSHVVGGANDPTTPEQRDVSAQSLNQIMQRLISIGNANDGTHYIFGGHNTLNPPFTVVNGRYVNYTGNKGDINIVVDHNSKMALNVSGDELYGNMTTTIPSKNMNPDVSLSTDHSTPLADLNGGNGIPKGKITIKYSAYPEGLDVDLTNCDTLEDVKDVIEQATLEASKNLNTKDCPWLDNRTLDWHDLQDRYVKVTVNPENNGISLQEFDMGEPLPDPTPTENYYGITYTGGAYAAGGYGIAAATPDVPTLVHDKLDPNGRQFPPLSVDDCAGNKVATGLGIKSTAKVYDPLNPDAVLDGFIHGEDLNPALTDETLLADLEGYNDGTYTFTNGTKPGNIVLKESSKDTNNVFQNWNLSGLTKNKNTGENGELYARIVNRGTDADPKMYVELYTRPVDKANASNMVAAGYYDDRQATVILEEVNNSGLSGSVGINLPAGAKTASVDLKAEFSDNLQATVHVPAFVEEQHANGLPKDVLGIASGWNIRGLDKPPAGGYDINHPASTDRDGDVSVNYRYDETDGYMYVELSRPSYDDQSATLVATGKIFVGTPGSAEYPVDGVTGLPTGMADALSGRVEFVGEPGFEGVGGSVYLELPRGTVFSGDSVVGAGAANATENTFVMREAAGAAPAPAPAPGDMVFGGAVEVQAPGMGVAGGFALADDTVFKAGQAFDNPVRLPGGGTLPAGMALTEDTLIKKGVTVDPANGDTILPGTVLAANQRLTVTSLPAGTVIPRGSYTVGAAGFPADGMSMTAGGVTMAGHDVRATFATVEDFQRAVREAGVYVDASINESGTGLEFTSTLAGAWLTVSEDTDCYEQMGDRNQQLTGLDLTGLVKGVNSDSEGNAFTEVIYYPPDPLHPGDKIKLHDKNGEIIEIDPGYYVRVYSDASQLDVPYEERDNTTMVAEGFVPAGEWDPAYLAQKSADEAAAIADYEAYLAALDATPGITPDDPRYLEPWTFTPTAPATDFFAGANLGIMENLVLEERNKSGVSGTVNLDYHGPRQPSANVTYHVNSQGNREFTFDYSPDDNSDITVYPGGFRQMTGRHVTVQEMDLYDPKPGVNTDADGAVHARISAEDPVTNNRVVELYRDGSHDILTARSDPAAGIGPNGEVTLYNVDKDGNFLDKAGNVLDATLYPLNQYGVVAGTMTVDATNLPAGEAEDFTMVTGAARNTGQEREENVFSTINNIIDAMVSDDSDELHNLLEDIQRDIDRALRAEGEVATRWNRLEMLSERHSGDIVNYQDIKTQRVGMNEEAYMMGMMDWQSAKNALDAAFQISSQTMNLSLLNYI